MKRVLALLLTLFLVGCEKNTAIIGNVEEKEANLIIVLLESKGISAEKLRTSTGTEAGGGSGIAKYEILVPENEIVDSISYLNQNGFPRQKGTDLLKLFEKQGLMSSDKEETIRYQAGLAQQLNNTILMMDGVIDASVQLSFPKEDIIPGQQGQEKKITAAIYVKHQGALEDSGNLLENKIKRLISGSVTGLNVNDVTVVADRSRFTDISLEEGGDMLSPEQKEYVSIWSIIMSKHSVGKFRLLFFSITTLMILFAILFGWVMWKFYPVLRSHGGLKQLLNPIPITAEHNPEEE